MGCDGAGSAVRKALGLRVEGEVDPRRFDVVDAGMTIAPPFERGGSDHAALVICIGRERHVVLLPLPGEDQRGLNGDIEVEDEGGWDGQVADLPFEAIERQVRHLVQRDIATRRVNWVSNFRVHARRTERFRPGRGFVAGDAAHVHAPAGGQGMNTGIQVAHNLAWKLALVLRHGAPDQLPDTYEEERLANVRRRRSTTDTFFEVLAGDSWAMLHLRKYALPTVMNGMPPVGPIRRHMFQLLSQAGVTRRGGSRAPPAHGPRGRVGPGDRLPHVVIDGEGLHARLSAPRFQVLVSNGAVAVAPLASEVERRFGGLVGVVVLPLVPAMAEVFGINEPFTLALRPDDHVAAIGRGADLDLMARCLAGVIRLPVQARRVLIGMRFAKADHAPIGALTR